MDSITALAGRFHRVLGLPTDFCGDDPWLRCVIDVIAYDWIMIRYMIYMNMEETEETLGFRVSNGVSDLQQLIVSSSALAICLNVIQLL